MMEGRFERLQVFVASISSLLLTMGVARFAYTPMLPLMQQQAGLGIVEGGTLAAINYMGYLSGAVIASFISDLHLKDRLYRYGLVLAIFSTVMMATSDSFLGWAVSRFLAGLSTTSGMLLGTGLVLNWLIRHDHRSELGIHFMGVGLSIAGCSALVAFSSQWLDWRGDWYLLSMVGCLLLVPALFWFPKPDTTTVSRSGSLLQDNPPSTLFLWLLVIYYFCAGVGYVVTATFIVAIVNHLPALEGKGNWAFLIIGLAAAPSCILWDLVARRVGDVNALIMVSALEVVGILLPLAGGGMVVTLFGSIFFGFSVIGAVSLVLTMSGRYFPTKPAKMMSRMTLSYGIAQIGAPALTGWLARTTGSYTVGLEFAAAVMGLGVLLLLWLKQVEKRDLLSADKA
jgi:predicted MFS family arabinose efflux permease